MHTYMAPECTTQTFCLAYVVSRIQGNIYFTSLDAIYISMSADCSSEPDILALRILKASWGAAG